MCLLQVLFRGLVNLGTSHVLLENQCIDQFVNQYEMLSVNEMLEVLELCVTHNLYCPDLYPIIASMVIEADDSDIKDKLTVISR